MGQFELTDEQKQVLQNSAQTLIVSASAGSGKTSVLIEYIAKLLCKDRVPIKKLLVLTFTNVAADEMKARLLQELNSRKPSKFLYDQIDDLPNADICTIDSFCERVIKKNIEKLELDQTFSVIDEAQAASLKSNAFENACLKFMLSNKEQYFLLFNCFKRNKQLVFECLKNLEDFLDSTQNPDEFLAISNDQDAVFKKSCAIVDEYFCRELERINKAMSEANILAKNEKTQKFLSKLQEIAEILQKNSIFDKIKIASQIELPNTPRGEDKVFAALRGQLNDLLQEMEQLYCDEQIFQEQKSGALTKAILQLYQLYKKQYQDLKAQDDFLDFADIEKLCARLLENADVQEQLQSAYQYVFIDEYQDTNLLQANLIKTVAQKCNFVAVGDPKQAIYGFRNATMEIMKQDINKNLSSSDGNVVFLRGNFRSDPRVLGFVNQIFLPLMTDQSVGIDYKATSMLDGLASYQESEEQAVEVCVLDEKNDEKTEKNQIYSVKNDILIENDKDLLEAKTICKYVDDMLVGKIYDVKQERWRAVELADIVVLLRGRGSLMTAVENELARHGIPVIADNKQSLTSNPQVQVLLNFLKLTLNSHDEVAWASVLLSRLCGMTIDEVAQIAKDGQEKTFLQNIFKFGGQKLEILQKNIQNFKIEGEVLGIRRAFENLFSRTQYQEYLHFLGEEQYQIVEKFLNLISQSGLEFMPASLLDYLENLTEAKLAPNGQQNAVSIKTIHGSKGMEYPIVILGGCGKSILSQNRTSYLISKELGLCTQYFDTQKMLKICTMQYKAASILQIKEQLTDEFMIFYVALTRAKNKLILTGEYNIENYSSLADVFDGRCYYDWIFYQKQSLLDNLQANDLVADEFAKYLHVSQVDDLKSVEKIFLATQKDEKLAKKIEKYLNFSYKNLNLSKIEFKNSVTGLLKLQLENEESFEQTTQQKKLEKNAKFTSSQIGTLYHLVLKETDFQSIKNKADLLAQLELLVQKGYLLQDEKAVLNADILYNAITVLARLTKNKQVYKERAFMMKLQLCEVTKSSSQQQVLVQGVVDMFALGEENILVDYKFTNITDREKLIEKYKMQIELYQKAIENAFAIKLAKKYIFSIKNCDLIEIF